MTAHSELFRLSCKIANAHFRKRTHSSYCAGPPLIEYYSFHGNTAIIGSNRRMFSSQDVSSHGVQTSRDLLMQNLKCTTDPKSLMEVVKVHHSIMNNKHVMQALRSLFELSKSESSHQAKQFVIQSAEFHKLCHTLKLQSRSLEINETIEALKIVSFLGLPSSSPLIQVLLQLVRYNVNELSLQHIVFLEFILKKFDSCPLVDALNIALPIVFEIQLPIKLDRENPSHMAEMLQYAVRNSLSDSIVSLLIDRLTGTCHKMDKKTAENITWVLLDVDRPVLSIPFLLRQTLNIVSENINSLSFDEVHALVSKVVKKYLKTSGNFYHEEFLDSCASYVIEKRCTLEKTCWILKKLTRLGHSSIKLLDYIANIVANDPNVLESAEPNTIFALTSGMSSANYGTKYWNVIEKSILKNKIMEEDKIELPWIKFTLELASLGCFHPPLLRRIFEEQFLRKFLARDYNLLDHLQLLMLFQAVITLFPSYSGPLPPDDIIQKASRLNGDNVNEFPLKGALEHGLGGASYLQTRFTTKLGHFIDHVIVMRKGGYPVAVNHSKDQEPMKQLIEDLIIPPDSKVILVLAFHRGCYTLNCKRLRGHFDMMCKGLEAMGYAVVPVSLSLWSDIPDYEKIPYLMQNIKSKCDMTNSEIKLVQ
ncbi:uncharacterized protein LOC124795518 isoform X1 [Schistocerca piceifrons]|uniref:uncharacterized protein LOC124795518 isoform X1 n=2 Tax=Schistocerca piceifrons TaxID=274613 RepID=UPI001F5F26C0|nr:uncharacterized protein LOC124795518 isoform X1 [Schistocerca piceifrons]XP_047115539.1 uncharacterized protein LOC124795518 isoform X1 [Schistocerca piceifrons]